MRISMEITMTDRSVLMWVYEVLGVGTLKPKTVKGTRKDGTPYLKQYKWRCTFRDAYYVCCLLWPFAHTKLPKIQQVIEHYTKDNVGPNGKDCYPIKKNAKIIDLKLYKEKKMLDKIVYNSLHFIMKWAGTLNAWAWRKHAKIIEDKRQKENEEYVKELQKKL